MTNAWANAWDRLIAALKPEPPTAPAPEPTEANSTPRTTKPKRSTPR